MEGNITIARSWNELNDFQLQEISHLYLNTPVDKFHDAYQQMILFVYLKNTEKKSKKFLKELINQVPISELEKHTTFLKDKIDLYRFPEIPGLIKPADRIEDITVKQFSTIDIYFNTWHKERSLINLKRLVATLYRMTSEYDELDLKEVAAITDQLPEKQMSAIALAFLFTRKYIEDKFPIVFPKTKKLSPEEKLQPTFKKKSDEFIPFDSVIVGMAMDELQPLGKKQDVNKVRIYEFLGVLSQTMLYHKSKQKLNEGK